jgi:aflatoxin B1 aldehyde reductase
MYRKRYWNDQHFEALNIIQAAADAHSLTMPEVALRWISHHSQLKREYGDSVLIGASNIRHLEQVGTL